mmetsp:Transcript_118486/g.335101  ORF Transcript_118486/g.335101 Transcript_118486/m.335101 type:complete len:144 (-) Transcript_118486:100-531(-)
MQGHASCVRVLLFLSVGLLEQRAVDGGRALRHRGIVAPGDKISLRQGGAKRLLVRSGPFKSYTEACDYCVSSFTKVNDPPAEPMSLSCACFALLSAPANGSANIEMYCTSDPNGAGYVMSQDGCHCNPHSMEQRGYTTCEPID